MPRFSLQPTPTDPPHSNAIIPSLPLALVAHLPSYSKPGLSGSKTAALGILGLFSATCQLTTPRLLHWWEPQAQNCFPTCLMESTSPTARRAVQCQACPVGVRRGLAVSTWVSPAQLYRCHLAQQPSLWLHSLVPPSRDKRTGLLSPNSPELATKGKRYKT